MKNYVKKGLIIVIVSLFGLPLMSQPATVPDNVMKAFNMKFPNAKQVRWDKESATEYEAEFMMDNKKMSASFDNNAKWMETETVIPENMLPDPVKTVLKKDFKEYKIKYVELSETPDKGKAYEIAMEKGEQNMEVVFNGKGKIVKKEMAKDEDDENGGD